MGGEDYKLTYFNVKGVAEPIRFIFAYAGIQYEDNRVERTDWPAIKNTTPWGTLPLLQVGEKALGQSNVICRYLGKKFNLSGNDDWENAKIDEFADALTDFGTAWLSTFKEKDEARKEELTKNVLETTVPKVFGTLDATIAGNNGSPYLVGEKLTWVDLKAAHYLDTFENSNPDALVKYPNLKKLKLLEIGYSPVNRLSGALTKIKDTNYKDSVGIYQIPCKDCPAIYIGETFRDVSTRADEHKNCLNAFNIKDSAVANHALTNNHRINFSKTELIEKETRYYRRKIKESLYIRQAPVKMNKDNGLKFNPIWSNLLLPYSKPP